MINIKVINVLSQDQIREMNRVNIINFIRNKDNTTKQEIAKELSLSIPTVTHIIKELIEDGFVVEAGVAKSTGGRKPMILEFEKQAKYSIGINMLPDRFEILLVNLKMEELDYKILPYYKETVIEKSMSLLLDSINEMIISNELSKKQILGVGISAPGIVDEDELILQNAPNLHVRDYDMKHFSENLGIKLYMENEANVAALAELRLGQLKQANSIVYISVTEGIGTGVVIDRKIFKGINKMAGEFGHMRISNENIQCNCGRTGCWEVYASKEALINAVSKKTREKINDLNEIFNLELSSTPEIEEVLQKYMDYLLVGIENIILGLNPEYVVIGGELGNYQDNLSEYIEKTKNSKSSILMYEGTKIIFSSLKSKGALLGAVLLPLETIFSYQGSI